MKKFAIGVMIGILGASAFAWDEERDISSEIYLPGIGRNVLNFQVRDPFHLTKEFYVGMGLLLGETWRLGVVGQFQNESLSSVNELSRTYHSNGNGTLGGIQSETKEQSFIGGPIRNLLWTYLGVKPASKLTLGFSLGGGLDYSVWQVTDMKYINNFTTAGMVNILNPGVDDNRMKSFRYKGQVPIQIGFGMSLLDRPFVNSADDVLDDKEFWYSLWRLNSQHRLRFGILGAGSVPPSLPVLSSSGISLAPFNGSGDQYYVEQTFLKNNSNLERSYMLLHNENFTYLSTRYEGMVETEINMHDWDWLKYQQWSRLRFIPEFNTWFEWRFYGNLIDEESTYYYENIFSHVNGDFWIKKTNYSVFPHLNFGVQFPLELDFRPQQEVQLRFLYTPMFGFEVLNYTAQYIEDHVQNGVNVSFKDPVLTGSMFRLTHNHSVNVRFRLEPVSVFRVTIGGTWTWSSYFQNDQLSAPDNVRKNANGSSGPGPYTQIPVNNKTVGSWAQTVSPQLDMNYQVIPNVATLTFKWEPALVVATPDHSSVLNLSNWNIQLVITYDSKSAPLPRPQTPEPETVSDPEVPEP